MRYSKIRNSLFFLSLSQYIKVGTTIRPAAPPPPPPRARFGALGVSEERFSFLWSNRESAAPKKNKRHFLHCHFQKKPKMGPDLMAISYGRIVQKTTFFSWNLKDKPPIYILELRMWQITWAGPHGHFLWSNRAKNHFFFLEFKRQTADLHPRTSHVANNLGRSKIATLLSNCAKTLFFC